MNINTFEIRIAAVLTLSFLCIEPETTKKKQCTFTINNNDNNIYFENT